MARVLNKLFRARVCAGKARSLQVCAVCAYFTLPHTGWLLGDRKGKWARKLQGIW